MITCNRCGTLNPVGILNCQVCGTPLASRIEHELSPRSQNQPALPAWLETLRAGERPLAPANGLESPGFSAADLLEEGSLPTWMRSGRADQQEPASSISAGSEASFTNPFAQSSFSSGFSQSGAQPVLRSAGQSGPNTGDEGLPPQAIAANSLIDEKSLPSWMQKDVKQTSQEPARDIPAASLLQPDALPEWMRSMTGSQAAPAYPEAKNFTSQPFASAPSSPVSPPVPEKARAALPLQPGFAAGELVDPQSLPSWMTQGSSQAAQGNAQGIAPAPAAQQGLSAASLLDASSLPSWMRQTQTGQGQGPGNVAPASSSQQSSLHVSGGANSWPAAPSPIQPSAQGQVGSIAASSFIDPNVLPEWMRGENAGGQVQSGRPGAYSGPAAQRIDNMRVPSRPRNELNATDNSEVAANVFASMLGVASSSPNYAGQVGSEQPSSPLAQSGPYAPAPTQMAQGGQPYPGSAAGMGSGIYGQVPATPPNYAQTAAPAYGIGSSYPQNMGYQGNMPGSYASGMAQNASPYGNPTAYPANGPVSPTAGPIFPSSTAEEQKPAKPAKRSIFDALRDFFSFR